MAFIVPLFGVPELCLRFVDEDAIFCAIGVTGLPFELLRRPTFLAVDSIRSTTRKTLMKTLMQLKKFEFESVGRGRLISLSYIAIGLAENRTHEPYTNFKYISSDTH